MRDQSVCIVVRDNLSGYCSERPICAVKCGERPICVDITVRDQSVIETYLSGYCGERPICVDIVARDKTGWILQ